MPLELRLWEEGEDRLADPSRVGGHCVTDAAKHPHRLRALHLLDVDDIRAAERAQVHSFASLLRKPAQHGQRLPPQVEALKEVHSEAKIGNPERIQAPVLVE